MSTEQDNGWRWWGGYEEEWCVYGPFLTRDEVIAAAQKDRLGEFQAEDGTWMTGIYICEARQDPLRLADWIDAEELLERADDNLVDSDRTGAECDDGPWFEATPEQQRDLVERVKRACDEWQAAHSLVFTSKTFSASRKHEHLVVPRAGAEVPSS